MTDLERLMMNVKDSSKYLERIKDTTKNEHLKEFLRNRKFILSLLSKDINIKEQVDALNNKTSCKFSISTYSKYCKIFFKNDFDTHIDNMAFYNSKEFIFYYAYCKEVISTEELYKKLCQDNKLLRHKSKKGSFLSYTCFYNRLKEFVKDEDISNIIFNRKLQNSPVANKEIHQRIEKSKPEKAPTVQQEKERIEIELLDGTVKKVKESYLRATFASKENETHQYFLNEKNRFYIRCCINDSYLEWDEVKIKIESDSSIPNYSLIIYDNTKRNNKIYIHRLINGNIVPIKDISSLYLLDNLEYFKNGLQKEGGDCSEFCVSN